MLKNLVPVLVVIQGVAIEDYRIKRTASSSGILFSLLLS
jgi:hypothetical protein